MKISQVDAQSHGIFHQGMELRGETHHCLGLADRIQRGIQGGIQRDGSFTSLLQWALDDIERVTSHPHLYIFYVKKNQKNLYTPKDNAAAAKTSMIYAGTSSSPTCNLFKTGSIHHPSAHTIHAEICQLDLGVTGQ